VSEYILVVDDRGTLKAACDAALEGCDVKLLHCTEITSAKRMLIQAIPCLIISVTKIDSIPDAGFSFCRALREHSEFSKIPVILASDQHDQELTAQAKSEGAKLLLPVSVSALDLRRVLHQLLPNIVAQPSVQPAKSQAAQSESSDVETAEKLKLAQHLLAKVLHNFKTSDLLQVIEKEDIPQVIFGITRTVCGISSEEPPKPESSQGVASSSDDDYVEIDLDAAFGIKK
jgi:PleD family two-component response regulator